MKLHANSYHFLGRSCRRVRRRVVFSQNVSTLLTGVLHVGPVGGYYLGGEVLARFVNGTKINAEQVRRYNL